MRFGSSPIGPRGLSRMYAYGVKRQPNSRAAREFTFSSWNVTETTSNCSLKVHTSHRL